jgi:chromosome segregation ATPase
MDNETIGQVLGILGTAIYVFLGSRAYLKSRKNSNGTKTDTYPALPGKDSYNGKTEVMTGKRDDAVGALVVTSNVLGETLTALHDAQAEIKAAAAARMEDVKSRAELRAQGISLQTDITVLKVDALEREKAHKEQVAELRADIVSLKAHVAEQTKTIDALRKEITVVKSDTSEREQQYKKQIEAQTVKIAEQDATITKQHVQIKALLAYVEALLPLLKKAGIDTKELPRLPDILDTAHGEAALVKPPAAE